MLFKKKNKLFRQCKEYFILNLDNFDYIVSQDSNEKFSIIIIKDSRMISILISCANIIADKKENILVIVDDTKHSLDIIDKTFSEFDDFKKYIDESLVKIYKSINRKK